MYNGMGLQTARGSGTNGYVQTNKFSVRSNPKTNNNINSEHGSGEGTIRKPNNDMLEHGRKRQVQLKLLELEEELADRGYADSEIAQKLNEAKKTLQENCCKLRRTCKKPFKKKHSSCNKKCFNIEHMETVQSPCDHVK